MKTLAPEEFADWLLIRHIHRIERHTNLLHASLLLDTSEPKARQLALARLRSSIDCNAAIFKSSKTGEKTTAAMAFLSAASSIAGLFDDLAENGPKKVICLHADYTAEDHFVIETSKGSIQIRAIVFGGELSLKEMHVPLMVTAEYRRFDSGEMISQIASFAPQSMRGMKFSTELHKMADTGATHVVFRRLDGSA